MNYYMFFLFFEFLLFGIMHPVFFLVVILQFINSFCFLGQIYVFHIRILSLDRHRDQMEQEKEQFNEKCKLYLAFFVIATYILNILFSQFWVTLLFGSIWLPQIRLNVQKN